MALGENELKDQMWSKNGSFWAKSFLEARERERRARVEEKSRFLWEVIPISGFQVIKKEERS